MYGCSYPILGGGEGLTSHLYLPSVRFRPLVSTYIIVPVSAMLLLRVGAYFFF